MKSASLSSDRYVIRLDPDDDILGSIEAFCSSQGIKNAVVEGIGSVQDPVLAHYRIDRKQFTKKPLEGIFEIVALTGNVAIYDGKPLAHIHVSLSDDHMRGYGGHLVKGRVSAAAELMLQPFDSSFQKAMDDDIGLKIWQLPE